jgi:hypothetical protein
MLSARARRPIRVYTKVVGIDVHGNVLGDLRGHVHRGERRVSPSRSIERRDAHEAMHSALGRQQPVRVASRNRRRAALDAGLIAGRDLDNLRRKPAPLRPPQVHAQEHVGPIL